jgi:hypothetical protein
MGQSPLLGCCHYSITIKFWSNISVAETVWEMCVYDNLNLQDINCEAQDWAGFLESGNKFSNSTKAWKSCPAK